MLSAQLGTRPFFSLHSEVMEATAAAVAAGTDEERRKEGKEEEERER